MRVRVYVDVDVQFGSPVEGMQGAGEDADVVKSAVTRSLQSAMQPILEHDIVECIISDTGLLVEGISATVGNE